MSKNIGLGHVFTDRPSFNKNCGCGLYDSSKVAYVEDPIEVKYEESQNLWK